MQSTTTGTEDYGPCMTTVGKWAYTYPNLLANAQLAAEAQNLYSEINRIYLQTSVSSVAAVRTVQMPTTPAARPRATQQTQQGQRLADSDGGKQPHQPGSGSEPRLGRWDPPTPGYSRRSSEVAARSASSCCVGVSQVCWPTLSAPPFAT